MTLTRIDHLALAREYAALPEWPVRPRFDPDERWYTRLAAGPDHEVWLLTWLPGQETDLHDHGGSEGAFLVVEGVLNEQTVVSSGEGLWLADRDYGAGVARRFGPRHVHRIRNTGTVPAMSVHVYGPALSTMTKYGIDNGRLVVTATDIAGEAW